MPAELPPGIRHTIQQQGGLSSDTRALMLYEANKKTALVAYILWFFLGLVGGHNFYLNAPALRSRNSSSRSLSWEWWSPSSGRLSTRS